MSNPAARVFCADVSRADDEPLAGTASRVDRWLLVEYRGLWAHEAVDGSALSGEVKAALRGWCSRQPRSRVVFVRRPDRRGHESLVVFAADAREGAATARRIELERHDDLTSLDLDDAGEPVEHPLLLVCTHGKHDPCCARFGRPLYEALRDQADPGWVWQVSHIGGDRFAGNLVTLPYGIYLGRVEPEHAWETLDELLAGRIPLDRYRGRCCHSFPVQAADHAIRRTTGLLGIDDLRLAAVSRREDGWRVRFGTVDGDTWEIVVVRRDGPLTRLTCSAQELRHSRHYAAAGPPVRVA